MIYSQRGEKKMNFIDKDIKMDRDCVLGNNVTILEDVKIGKNVRIGHNVVIYPNTKIGDDVEIQDNSVIGKLPRSSAISCTKIKELTLPTIIGDGTFIGALCSIYATTQIGKECLIGDLASIREGCSIDDFTIVGRSVTVECNTKIGKYVKIQTACHITADMIIEDYVFFGPEVTTMNDKYMGRIDESFNGPHVKRGVRVGGNATILPGVIIGEDAVIGAGAVVTKDIPSHVVAFGVPAKPVKEVPKEHFLKSEGI